ncbi:MAG: tRNA lysidine(34) synthetase TilS [Terriglobales bacterium]
MADSDPLLRRFGGALDAEQLLRAGDRVGIAVSGGADSVALLRLLSAVGGKRGLQLSVIHFDHGWRSGSGAEARFVAALARQQGLEIHLERASAVPQRDREQQARHQRYAFFQRLRAQGAVEVVATAHTADDQAETVLLRLLRGTGPGGLAAILPRRADGIVRPLLGFRRAGLRAWLQAQEQTWMEDASNLDLSHPRNRLRLQFIPELERSFNPALVQHLAELAELARAEEEFWTGYVGALWGALWVAEPGGGSIERGSLLGLPLAVQRRMVREGIRRIQHSLRGVDALAIEEILQWMADPDRHPRRRRLGRCLARTSARKLTLSLADTL